MSEQESASEEDAPEESKEKQMMKRIVQLKKWSNLYNRLGREVASSTAGEGHVANKNVPEFQEQNESY